MSLLVGLSTTGLEWDTASSFASHFRQDIATALLSGNPYAAAAAVLSNVAADQATVFDAPDPVVAARIYVDGAVAGTAPMTTSDQNHDTFFPTFPSTGWADVPLDATLRIEVNVADEDLTDYEPICIAQLDTNDVVMALDAGRVLQVDVSAQCASQLLFVGLSVVGTD